MTKRKGSHNEYVQAEKGKEPMRTWEGLKIPTVELGETYDESILNNAMLRKTRAQHLPLEIKKLLYINYKLK
jgi:hypothetical protein